MALLYGRAGRKTAQNPRFPAGPRQRPARPPGLGVFYQLYCVPAIEAAVTLQLLTAQEDIVNQFKIATALLDDTHADMLEPAVEPEPEVNQSLRLCW